MSTETKSGKIEIGDTGTHRDYKTPDGFSSWVENGILFIAKTVDPEKFGRHDYHDDAGIHRGHCRCGCHMSGWSSSGDVDPFGACPMNLIA